MADARDLAFYSATGNRFALADGIANAPPDDPARLASELARRAGLDGLLVCAPPAAGGDCRMVVYNADGSRPEFCGNGLRCIARFALERGHARGDELVIETDAGPRRVRVRREAGEIVGARSAMGTPRVVERETELEVAGQKLRATLVDLGNPHCVVFVEQLEAPRIAALGAALEHHPRFPERTNSAFVRAREHGLAARFFERGVGETESCGSGACAAAIAAILHERARSPVEVSTRGGPLRIEWDGGSSLFLEGAVEVLEAPLARAGPS